MQYSSNTERAAVRCQCAAQQRAKDTRRNTRELIQLDGYAELAQTKWAAWRRRQDRGELPEISPIRGDYRCGQARPLHSWWLRG